MPGQLGPGGPHPPERPVRRSRCRHGCARYRVPGGGGQWRPDKTRHYVRPLLRRAGGEAGLRWARLRWSSCRRALGDHSPASFPGADTAASSPTCNPRRRMLICRGAFTLPQLHPAAIPASAPGFPPQDTPSSPDLRSGVGCLRDDFFLRDVWAVKLPVHPQGEAKVLRRASRLVGSQAHELCTETWRREWRSALMSALR